MYINVSVLQCMGARHIYILTKNKQIGTTHLLTQDREEFGHLLVALLEFLLQFVKDLAASNLQETTPDFSKLLKRKSTLFI